MLSNFYMGNSNCSCGKRLYSFTPPPESVLMPYEGKRCKKCPYCFCAECLTDGVCKTCVLDTETETETVKETERGRCFSRFLLVDDA